MRKPAKKFGRRYPWSDWFEGAKFTLVPGRDYECMPHSMAIMVRQEATSRGLRVKITIAGSGKISVQIVGPKPQAPTGRQAGCL